MSPRAANLVLRAFQTLGHGNEVAVQLEIRISTVEGYERVMQPSNMKLKQNIFNDSLNAIEVAKFLLRERATSFSRKDSRANYVFSLSGAAIHFINYCINLCLKSKNRFARKFH